MVSKRDEKLVLWPIYFDAEASRPWRRVPKDLAVYHPMAEDVARVAMDLRLHPILEKGVAHPIAPWDKRGRVLVDVRGSKSVLVRQIGEQLREYHDARMAQNPRQARAPR